MELYHYPYHFVQRVYEYRRESNDFLKYKLLYAFKSTKSHQWYWVWIEVYKHDIYAVKFHLKVHRNSPHKYSLMTGLNEPRPVVNTCIAIMLEIAIRFYRGKHDRRIGGKHEKIPFLQENCGDLFRQQGIQAL